MARKNPSFRHVTNLTRLSDESAISESVISLEIEYFFFLHGVLDTPDLRRQDVVLMDETAVYFEKCTVQL